MLQCIITALDRNPVEFAAFLPPFLALYSTNALTAPDATGVAALPAKRRVLLTTFLARALVCPHYEASMIKFIKMKGLLLSWVMMCFVATIQRNNKATRRVWEQDRLCFTRRWSI